MRDEDGFIFENLKVYQRSLKLAIELTRIAMKFPMSCSRLRDQLVGAAFSVPLNLAEGSGRISQKDKTNFYKNSRASVFELVPITEAAYSLGLISETQKDYLRREYSEISKIVSSLMS